LKTVSGPPPGDDGQGDVGHEVEHDPENFEHAQQDIDGKMVLSRRQRNPLTGPVLNPVIGKTDRQRGANKPDAVDDWRTT
jgi:hypothetical protein